MDVRTDQYHFTKLQTPRQAKNEGSEEFTNRCRGMAGGSCVKSTIRLLSGSTAKTRYACVGPVVWLVYPEFRDVRCDLETRKICSKHWQ